jgi:hypothetical protein
MTPCFHNHDLDALNVLEVDVDLRVIARLEPFLGTHQTSSDFYRLQPPWASDIEWISPNTLAMFRVFREVFDDLNVAATVEPLLDIAEAPRLYSGFFVSRSRCAAPNFHEDWIDTLHQAFTLITPIQLGDPPTGLLYKRVDGSESRYPYQRGKALIFGDKFIHSTEPGCCAPPVVLLSFTFGTDRMRYWDRIARTGAYQGNLVRRPDGTFLCHDFDR